MFVKRQSMRESSGVFLGQALLPGTKRRHNPPFFFYFCNSDLSILRQRQARCSPQFLRSTVEYLHQLLSTFQQIDRSKKKNNPRAIFRFIKHALAEPLSLTHTHTCTVVQLAGSMPYLAPAFTSTKSHCLEYTREMGFCL